MRSGSEAESDAMHEIARLRAAARVEVSSPKSAARHSFDSASARHEAKRRSRSLSTSRHSSFTSSLSLCTPSSSPGVTRRMAVPAIDEGISTTIVLSPMAQMSRCSSEPVSTLLHKLIIISSTYSSCTLRTSGVRHLTASDCTSEDWSLIRASRLLHMRRSPSESGLNESLESSANRSEVAMYRKSLSRFSVFSRSELSAKDDDMFAAPSAARAQRAPQWGVPSNPPAT